jgi:hypothetical protein
MLLLPPVQYANHPVQNQKKSAGLVIDALNGSLQNSTVPMLDNHLPVL